jgi:branched-chain amino acid transport system ATP-binding protein
MLEVNEIDVFRGDIRVLWSVSLKVEERTITALLGSNAAGKTSLLMSISGLIKPMRGSIRFNGVEITKEPAHRIVEIGMSMVPEGRRLFPEMSVLENLELGAFLKRARNAKDRAIEEIYEIFPILKSRATQMAGTLSGGEQQMVAIGRALMSRPKLLLIDELSLGLAPLVLQHIAEIIKEINVSRGLTIFIVEQNALMTLEMAQFGYLIENGRIVGSGETKSLLQNEQIKNAYFGI